MYFVDTTLSKVLRRTGSYSQQLKRNTLLRIKVDIVVLTICGFIIPCRDKTNFFIQYAWKEFKDSKTYKNIEDRILLKIHITMETGNDAVNLFCFDLKLKNTEFVRGGIIKLACSKRILECLEKLFDVRLKSITESSVEKVSFVYSIKRK